MKNLFLIIINCLLLFISVNAQTYYEGDFTGEEKDAAILKARDSMLVAADTTTKVAMQWELNGKLDDADSTDIRTFSNSRYAYKNFMDASDGDPDSALYIDATGQVGIGTTTPMTKLSLGSAGQAGGFNFYNSTLNTVVSSFAQETDTSSLNLQWTSTTHKPILSLKGATGNAIFDIDSAGRVGIGTTTPDQLLTINSINASTNSLVSFKQGETTKSYIGLGGDGAFRLQTLSGTPLLIQSDGANYISLITNSLDRLLIQSDGNVGIGTITAYNKLSVISSNATNVNAFNFVDTDVNTNITTAATAKDTSAISGWFSGSGSPSFTVIGKGGETLLKVDSSGIGTNNGFNYAADTSSSDAYDIVLSTISALVTGLEVTFKAVTANTDGATLIINALTEKAITKAASGAINTALATGDILAGQIVKCVYDGTQWQIISRLAQ